jgi:hypothetical protein
MASRRNRSRMNTRRNRRRSARRGIMYGGQPAPVGYSLAASDPAMQSLGQGKQYEEINRNFHGGASLVGGPYPGVVAAPTILPEDLRASARVAPLDTAIAQVSGLKDNGTLNGGARNRKNRKASRKNRKNRKNRKASRKNRKASRKASRKSRRTRRYRGGAYSLENAGPFSMTKSDMLLSPEMEAKALQGMNTEWKLAENPQAFAPGYKNMR